MKEYVNRFKSKECELPKIGDYAFTIKDFRQENPFVIIDILETAIVAINVTQRYESKVYDIIGVSENDEFRKFRFSDGAFHESIKLRENSKEVKRIIKELFKTNIK